MKRRKIMYTGSGLLMIVRFFSISTMISRKKYENQIQEIRKLTNELPTNQAEDKKKIQNELTLLEFTLSAYLRNYYNFKKSCFHTFVKIFFFPIKLSLFIAAILYIAWPVLNIFIQEIKNNGFHVNVQSWL